MYDDQFRVCHFWESSAMVSVNAQTGSAVQGKNSSVCSCSCPCSKICMVHTSEMLLNRSNLRL